MTYEIHMYAIHRDNPIQEIAVIVKCETQTEAHRIVIGRYPDYRINHTLRKDE